MIKIEDIVPGKSYACKYKVETMLDEFGRPYNMSDAPLKGTGVWEGVGILEQRDLEKRLVRLRDRDYKINQFVVSFDDIWDIDEIEWIEDES